MLHKSVVSVKDKIPLECEGVNKILCRCSKCDIGQTKK